MRAPREVGAKLHSHYDNFPPTASGKEVSFQMSFSMACSAGVPLELLQGDFWVPGATVRSEMAANQQWKEILTPSGFTCILWVGRLIKDSKN